MQPIFAVVLAGTCLMSAALRAEEYKCPTTGLSVRLSNGNVIRYDGQDGLWRKRSIGGKPISSELGHVAFYDRARADGDEYGKWQKAVAELWPIAPGKSVTFIYQGQESGSGGGATYGSFIYAHDISVGSPRQITVPAGTFTVFPIVDLLRGTVGNSHRSRRTYYYAPELGANVKFDFEILQGTIANQPKPWEVGAVIPPK